MKQSVKILSVLVALAMFPAAPSHAQQTRNADVAEAEYSRTIGERSDKIVATLGITNSVGAKKVQAIIVQQYRDLREIQDRRDAQVKAVKAKAEDVLKQTKAPGAGIAFHSNSEVVENLALLHRWREIIHHRSIRLECSGIIVE